MDGPCSEAASTLYNGTLSGLLWASCLNSLDPMPAVANGMWRFANINENDMFAVLAFLVHGLFIFLVWGTVSYLFDTGDFEQDPEEEEEKQVPAQSQPAARKRSTRSPRRASHIKK